MNLKRVKTFTGGIILGLLIGIIASLIAMFIWQAIVVPKPDISYSLNMRMSNITVAEYNITQNAWSFDLGIINYGFPASNLGGVIGVRSANDPPQVYTVQYVANPQTVSEELYEEPRCNIVYPKPGWPKVASDSLMFTCLELQSHYPLYILWDVPASPDANLTIAFIYWSDKLAGHRECWSCYVGNCYQESLSVCS